MMTGSNIYRTIFMLMDQKVIRMVYYLVCLVLALMLIKGTNQKQHQTTGFSLTLSFILLVLTYSGFRNLYGYAIIAMTLGYLFFIVNIVKSKSLTTPDKILLIILPTVTVTILYNKVLHLPYATGLKFISILICPLR